MTQETHTPAPWVTTGWNNLTVNAICGDWPDANEYTIVLMTGGPALNSGRQELEVMQANARLIAAAPDMFAALTDALPWLGAAIANNAFADCALPLGAKEALGRMTDAITKAKGA